MGKRRQLEIPDSSAANPGKSVLGVKQDCAHAVLDDLSLAWEETGEGVPVVCLHAAGHGARDFSFLKNESPSHCRLIFFDWPGHGRSSDDQEPFTVERCVDLLAAFLKVLGLRSVVLLGSEFGAAVALAFAMQHRLSVRGLLLCQPAGFMPPATPRQLQGVRRAVRRCARALLLKPARTAAELEQAQVDSFADLHADQCAQAARSVSSLGDTLRMALTRELCPTLIALASKSEVFPLKPLLEMLNPFLSPSPFEQPLKPRVAIFSGRYSPLWESPARLARVVSGFAASTLPLETHPHSWILTAVDWPTRGMNHWLCTHPGCHAAQSLPVDINPNLSGR